MADILKIANEIYNLEQGEFEQLQRKLAELHHSEVTYCQDIYETGSLSFSSALWALKNGKPICREGWNGKGMFVVRQVPAHITGDIIPNMQSLPQSAKDILMAREDPHIDYTCQMLIINRDGRADSWVPSSADVLAEDWMIFKGK